jgi:hypothetical protein
MTVRAVDEIALALRRSHFRRDPPVMSVITARHVASRGWLEMMVA